MMPQSWKISSAMKFIEMTNQNMIIVFMDYCWSLEVTLVQVLQIYWAIMLKQSKIGLIDLIKVVLTP